MAIDRERAPFVAARRFGLGAGPGEIERLRADPRGAVLAQVDAKAALLTAPGLVPAAEALRRTWAHMEEAKRMAENPPPPPSPPRTASPDGAAMAEAARPMAPPPPGAPDPAPAKARPVFQEIFEAEFAARLDRQISTTTPLAERMVNFWSNHFCVAAGKSAGVRASTGAYEREAVRPHVFGRFRDMLRASARHPAMLAYLDNFISIGPRSKTGTVSGKGLNENLGREILELHTLGVDGGYTQADVTAFSTALTGWGIANLQTRGAEPGTFFFAPANHEPGTVRILGRDYPQTGPDQAAAALDDFARHPATARHVARKLVRHFVGDRAPAGLADRLATVFRDTDGDLAAVTRALIGADDAWNAPPAKILSPWEILVTTGRVLGIDWSFPAANRMLNLFGQPLWDVPFPQGWPDDDEAWAAPASLLELLDAMSALAARNAGDRSVTRLAGEVLGPQLHPSTRRAIERAETRSAALALLLMSPDFLRR